MTECLTADKLDEIAKTMMGGREDYEEREKGRVSWDLRMNETDRLRSFFR